MPRGYPKDQYPEMYEIEYGPVDGEGNPPLQLDPPELPGKKPSKRTKPRKSSRVPTKSKVDPAHYFSKSGQELIDVLEDFGLTDNAYRFAALQYMFRTGSKDGEDTVTGLKKAIWYIEREINSLGGK